MSLVFFNVHANGGKPPAVGFAQRRIRARLRRPAPKLITAAVVDNLLSWHHSGFSAHATVCVQDREGAVRLGRYIIRCPIVLERLAWDEGAGQVVCRSRPTRRSRPLPAEARWDVLEFLARVIDHIPEPSQQTVRYWGYYSNAARGKRRKAAEAGVRSQTSRRLDDDEFTRSSRLSWAKLIRRVYEVDPLLCPFCGAEMRILAFILDFATAKAIRDSLELPAQEPQPLAHAPPETLELIAESA